MNDDEIVCQVAAERRLAMIPKAHRDLVESAAAAIVAEQEWRESQRRKGAAFGKASGTFPGPSAGDIIDRRVKDWRLAARVMGAAVDRAREIRGTIGVPYTSAERRRQWREQKRAARELARAS